MVVLRVWMFYYAFGLRPDDHIVALEEDVLAIRIRVYNSIELKIIEDNRIEYNIIELKIIEYNRRYL
jgi:hypothetical protein